MHPKNIDYHIFKLMNNKNVTHIGWPFLLFYSLTYSSVEWGSHGYKYYFLEKLVKYADVVDALIVLHFENLTFNVFQRHICFILLQVFTIM